MKMYCSEMKSKKWILVLRFDYLEADQWMKKFSFGNINGL